MNKGAGLCTAYLFSAFFLVNSCNSATDTTVTAATRDSIKNPNGRNDAWGFAGYGGGGAMFYPAVSPFNRDYAFVACDMTGSFVTYNGGESWRMFNLRGPVDFFVLDPLDADVVYAASIALFKSTDKGNTWKLLYPAPADVQGIISKGDHATEIIVTKDNTIRKILSFAVDPANSKKLYAVISIDRSISFYTSGDAGQSWTKEKDLPDRVSNIYINPSSPANNRTIYLTSPNTILVKENGQWITNNGPVNVKKITTYAGGFDSKLNKYIIYGISGKSYFNPEGDISGIFYTANGGETWENRQTGLVALQVKGAALPEWRTIATSALHPGTVYISYNRLQVGPDTSSLGVAKSEDYGKTWTLPWKDMLHKNGNSVAANFKGGWIDERFGPTWGENPFSIGVSPVDPAVCYATDFGRTIKTTDGGKTWDQLYTRKKENAGWISRGLEVTTGYSIVFDPFDTTHVFIANTDVGLMESKDGGDSWQSATQNNGIPRPWVNSTYWLTFDPDIKGKAWAVMSGTHDLPRPKMWRKNEVAGYKGGIVTTDNGGKTWTGLSDGIGEAAFTHILLDPASDKTARTLYACAFGKGVFKSVDGGKSWQQKNKGLKGTEPFAWRITKNEKNGVLFLVVSRRSSDSSIGSENDGAVYRSDDGAENWTRVALPAGTNAPTSLAADGERLILSAWGRLVNEKLSADTGGGIFISSDEGKTWKQVLEKDQHIHDITFDPRNNRYYACGFNGSAYRSSDKGETWQRIKGYNFKWGKRVDIDPRDPAKIFIVTFGGGVWHGPADGDSSAAEDIISPEFSR